MRNDLTISILGWKSPVTTRHSLETYRETGLYDCCEDFFVYYNQYSPEDKALCDEMGVRSCGTPENSGNWGGQKGILAEAKTDYVLFLENDHPVVVSHEEMAKWIDGGLELLKSGKADIVLFRHRLRFGVGYGYGKFFDYHYVRRLDPRYERYSPGKLPEDYDHDTFGRWVRRLLRPFSARRRSVCSLYLEENPESILPRQIRREGDFLIVDSSIMNFTESPFMISRDFYNRLSAWAEKHPRHRTILGLQNLEYIFNCSWWRRQHFRIATCDTGIFSHERRDDSWRPNHGSFNQRMVEEGAVK